MGASAREKLHSEPAIQRDNTKAFNASCSAVRVLSRRTETTHTLAFSTPQTRSPNARSPNPKHPLLKHPAAPLLTSTYMFEGRCMCAWLKQHPLLKLSAVPLFSLTYMFGARGVCVAPLTLASLAHPGDRQGTRVVLPEGRGQRRRLGKGRRDQ